MVWKEAMIEEQVLGIANVTKPFEVETNASNYELGVEHPHHIWKPKTEYSGKEVYNFRKRNAHSGPLSKGLKIVFIGVLRLL